MNNKNNFLNPDVQELIRSTVAGEERVTSGEIVPMIVRSSHHYTAASLLSSMTLSMITAPAVTMILGRQDMWTFVALYVLFIIPFYVLAHNLGFLKRLFTSRTERSDAVKQGAFAAFYSNGLYRTRDETGILIYISLFERSVWILADRGINQKVPAGTWDRIVTDITDGIHAGNGVDALIKAIRHTGDILKKHFPVKKDDRNELNNLIIDNKTGR